MKEQQKARLFDVQDKNLNRILGKKEKPVLRPGSCCANCGFFALKDPWRGMRDKKEYVCELKNDKKVAAYNICDFHKEKEFRI